MSATASDKAQLVETAIREISHIATLPEITLKIVELVEDPKSTAQDLHKVISNDPALCSRILKVVNSSFYGLPGQIGSINRAIVLLGLNAVKNIAIAASLAKLFRGGEMSPHFSAKTLWEHSVGTAGACKLIADRLKFGFGDEAFLAGLIHDIGIMVEMQYDRNRLVEVVAELDVDEAGTPANCMLEVEEKIFGANHQEFGKALCERWKFPNSFSTVTGHHHDPMSLPPDNRTLVCVVYLADRLVPTVSDGFRLDLANLDIDPAVRDELKLTNDKIEDLIEALPEHLKSVGDMLS
jgi:HD-like signal output (HDOD) protein